MNRTLDYIKLQAAQAQAAREELPFSVQAHIGPASEAAARAAAHYTALAREAELLSALRQAVEHIDLWASWAFRPVGCTVEDFHRAWKADEHASWVLTERLRAIACMPQPEPHQAWCGDE